MVEKGADFLKKMEISVAEAEKRTGKNAVSMQETYTVYLIETRYSTSFIHLYKNRGTFISSEHHQHVLTVREIFVIFY